MVDLAKKREKKRLYYQRNKEAIKLRMKSLYEAGKADDSPQFCAYCHQQVAKRVLRCKIAFCNNTCKSEWQRLQKPVDKDWLEQKYLIEAKSANEIAKIVHRDPKRVWEWLRDYEIPLRPRGHNYKKTILGWYERGEESPFKGRKHTTETKHKLSKIAKEQGRVPYDPAVGSYMKGKRGSEVPNWKGGVTPERQAFYSSPQWQRVARKVRERDDFTCQKCGCCWRDNQSLSFDIHHIVPFPCRELRCTLSNLVLLCEPCHYWVHSRENVNKLFVRSEP